MTVTAAVKGFDKDGKPMVFIGADSECTMDGQRILGANIRKLYAFNGAVVGMAGTNLVAEVLEVLQEDEGFQPKFKTKADIRDFAYIFFTTFTEMADIVYTEKDTKDPLDCHLIIATSEAIWALYPDSSILEFDYFYANGVGATTAQAVLHDRLHDDSSNIDEDYLKEVLYRALVISTLYSEGCGLPINIMKVDPPEPYPELEAPPEKKEKKKKPKKCTMEFNPQ